MFPNSEGIEMSYRVLQQISDDLATEICQANVETTERL